jgi:hypothetical protein
VTTERLPEAASVGAPSMKLSKCRGSFLMCLP